MPLTFPWLYRKLGRRYFWVFVAFEIGTSLIVSLATLGMFTLYEDIPAGLFWELYGFSVAWIALGLAIVVHKTKHVAEPMIDWLHAGKPQQGALEVWRTALLFPRQVVLGSGWQPFALVAVPITAYATIRLGLPWYSAAIILAGALIGVLYATVLHFFASEQFLRPIVEEIARRLPRDQPAQLDGVPLRWKLLGALPVINVITGVVVSGLSTDARASLTDLGFDVIIAVLVAFTVSLELTLLVTKSVLGPVDDLLEVTEQVKRGDIGARVPLTSGDELGRLAASFNEMLGGLEERERLRTAFGSYVDPDVAERVLAEGELLEGQEIEASILFVDVRDFTPFAERSSARETVAFLNRFFDLVVPIVLEHGGHANKFVGDGLLASFGVPDRVEDHADRALAAACAIVAAVDERFAGTVRVGVGLNSGPVVAGSVGGGGRLEFAVIGDAVNVAARVEQATRETGDSVLLTEATRRLLGGGGNPLEGRGELELKGKAGPVRLYATVDERMSSYAPRLSAEA